jgi:hypothetical protein
MCGPFLAKAGQKTAEGLEHADPKEKPILGI